MAEKHNFSPVVSEEAFSEALEYIALQGAALTKAILGYELPADTLTIFSHFEAENVFLRNLLKKIGRPSRYSHGATFYVETDRRVKDQTIKILGVRAPDNTRPQVGYADFPVTNYDRLLALDIPFITQIESSRGQRLLEIRNPDFDILGYIVDAKDH